METQLFHVITWNNYGPQNMAKNAWFYTRVDAEQHAALIKEVMGAMVSTLIATTEESRRLGL